MPQEINIFPLLTVEENLQHGRLDLPPAKAAAGERIDRVYAIFPALAERRALAAGTLSGGQGRMLSIAREMMTEPQLMLVDEPTAGLSPAWSPRSTSSCYSARQRRQHHPVGRPECRRRRSRTPITSTWSISAA